MISGDGKDRELDKYLQGDSELSRAYRQASLEEPPGYLDEAILAAAKRQVGPRPRIAYSPFSADWHVPLSIAAVLVLCVTLVITIQETGNDSYQTAEAIYENEWTRAVPAEGNTIITTDYEKTVETITTDGSEFPITPALGIEFQTPDEDATPAAEPARVTTVGRESDTPDGNRRQRRREAFVSPPPGRMQEAEQAEREILVSRAPEPVLMEMPADEGGMEDAVVRSRPAPMLLRGQTISGPAKDQASVAGNGNRIFTDTDQSYSGLFLTSLAGAWEGRATITPVGPTKYDLNFAVSADNCLSGTADNGLSHHTWEFCAADDDLLLDFQSDVEGNETPIHFHMVENDGKTATFHADSHAFMELIIDLTVDEARIQVLHHDRLHAEIELSRE